MCLIHNKRWTKHFKKKFTKYLFGFIPIKTKKQEFKAYKIYRLDKEHKALLSMYQCQSCPWLRPPFYDFGKCPYLYGGEKHVDELSFTCRHTGVLVTEPGVTRSNRTSKKLDNYVNDDSVVNRYNNGILEWEISRGIHVHLTKESAENHIKSYINNAKLQKARQNDILIIVPVQCHIDDLIGIDYYYLQAALMKINISNDAFHEAMLTEENE